MGPPQALFGPLRVMLCNTEIQQVQDEEPGGAGGHGAHPQFLLLAGDEEGIVGQTGERVAVGLGDGDHLGAMFFGRLGGQHSLAGLAAVADGDDDVLRPQQ